MKKTFIFLFLLLSITSFSQSQIVAPLQVCDDNNDGFAMFNLTDAIPQILSGLNPSQFNVVFYTTAVDAASGANVIPNPSSYSNFTPVTQVIYFTIVNLANNQTTIDSILLMVNARPFIGQQTFSSCIENGVADFDMGLIRNQVLQQNNANSNSLMVNFYMMEAEAQTQTNMLGNNYYSTQIGTGQIYVNATNMITGCSTIAVLYLSVNDCSGAPCGPPSNLNITSIGATAATINWSAQSTETAWQVYVVPAASAAPTDSTAGMTVSTNSIIYNNLACQSNFVAYVRTTCGSLFSDWSAPVSFQTLPCASVISVNDDYSTEQLINSILLNEDCANGINVVTQGDCGVAYFNNNDSTFPFEEGMIIRSGTANMSVGPYTTGNFDSSVCSQLGDPDLQAITNNMGQTGAINDVTSVKFNFVATSNLLSFNFIFASNEYGEFQCAYSDVFGFILTDLTTGVKQNIAVIPGTNIPISTTTIRDSAYNNSCPSANPAFFGVSNVNNPNSPISFKGQTVPMTAFATLIPNREYSLKLAVGDYQDTAYDSAVFIEGGSIAFGTQCRETIQLIAFVDENNNNVKDANEVNYTQGTFNYTINGDPDSIESQSSNGVVILFPENISDSYGFEFIVYPELADYFTTNTTYENVIFDINETNIYYFPVQNIQPYNDVQVSLTPINGPAPGFTYFNKIMYKNVGIAPVSGTLNYTKSSALAIMSNIQGDATTTSNGFTYNYTNLLPNETRTILVGLEVPTIPFVSLGQPINNSATSVNASDINLENNTSLLTQIVSGSYDPNDKMESHGGKIIFEEFSADDYLYYTIRFQNSGTANAQFIRIEDNLDDQLDENSLRMVASSHDYTLTRQGNLLQWTFSQINLPPTIADEIGSNGFVTFKIKVKLGLAVGDVIPNTASIFFDYNPAIITNTCQTEFTELLSNPNFSAENVVIHPNPAKDFIQITLNNFAGTVKSVQLFDLLGKIIVEHINTSENQIVLNTSSLSKGIYLIKVTSESNESTVKKLVIQ